MNLKHFLGPLLIWTTSKCKPLSIIPPLNITRILIETPENMLIQQTAEKMRFSNTCDNSEQGHRLNATRRKWFNLLSSFSICKINKKDSTENELKLHLNETEFFASWTDFQHCEIWNELAAIQVVAYDNNLF